MYAQSEVARDDVVLAEDGLWTLDKFQELTSKLLEILSHDRCDHEVAAVTYKEVLGELHKVAAFMFYATRPSPPFLLHFAGWLFVSFLILFHLSLYLYICAY